ncbi:3-ketoacyl-CoA thiolase, mitochondrial [Branchiostoma belcheri]|nr:3-ketoacyl-CoA thiolase, mitochondrial [Branchiostoma belcheri]
MPVTAPVTMGVCDGAAAVVIAGEDAMKKYNLTPLARLVGYHYYGCEPSIMGIRPVPAIEGLLQKTGAKLADVDLVEVCSKKAVMMGNFCPNQMRSGLGTTVDLKTKRSEESVQVAYADSIDRKMKRNPGKTVETNSNWSKQRLEAAHGQDADPVTPEL